MDALVLVTLGIFLVGVIFDAGQKSARLTALEKWQAQCASDMGDIKAGVERLLERRSHARNDAEN
jgi:hypothetical protein